MPEFAEAIEESETRFEQKIDLNPLVQGIRGAAECCVRFPQFAPILDALREAASEKLCTSRLLVPVQPKGVGVLIQWRHNDTKKGGMSEEGLKSQGHLFRLWKKLQKRGADRNLIIEGPPYECRMPQNEKTMIPGTVIPAFSERGQEYLLKNPGNLHKLLRKHDWTFEHATWLQDPSSYHGLEKPESYAQTKKMLLTQMQNVENLDRLTKQIINSMLDQSVGFTRGQPRCVEFQGQHYPLQEIIDKGEAYCKAIETVAASHGRRDDEAVTRMEEAAEEGEVAKVCLGAFHRPGVSKVCAERNLALCVVTPMEMNLKEEQYSHFRITESNNDYQLLKFVLPQLKNIASLP